MTKFLAGALLGLVAGLLLAPDKGENTRDNLANTADKWREKINRLVNRGGIGLDDLRDYLQQDISGLSSDIRNRILTILDEAEEMAYNPNPTSSTVTNGVA